jgi:hypothetical protein
MVPLFVSVPVQRMRYPFVRTVTPLSIVRVVQ